MSERTLADALEEHVTEAGGHSKTVMNSLELMGGEYLLEKVGDVSIPIVSLALAVSHIYTALECVRSLLAWMLEVAEDLPQIEEVPSDEP